MSTETQITPVDFIEGNVPKRKTLWHVTYDVTCSDEGKMIEKRQGYVLTDDDKVDSVEKELITSLDSGSYLGIIHEATWFGKTLNAV